MSEARTLRVAVVQAAAAPFDRFEPRGDARLAVRHVVQRNKASGLSVRDLGLWRDITWQEYWTRVTEVGNALLALGIVRWRHRSFLVAMVVLGVIIAALYILLPYQRIFTGPSQENLLAVRDRAIRLVLEEGAQLRRRRPGQRRELDDQAHRERAQDVHRQRPEGKAAAGPVADLAHHEIAGDGAECPAERIPLVNDRREHFVEVALG